MAGAIENNNNAISVGVMPGGGTQGLISVYTAEEFEKRSGREFHKNFDQLEGLSVGALNAASLWPLAATGKPVMRLSELKDFYQGRVDGTFDKKWLSLGGLLDNVYDMEEFENLLNEIFGDLKLSDYQDGLHIFVLDVESQELRVLTSEAAKQDSSQDFYMRDLLRTAISAPFYFEPKEIRNMAAETVKFIDAGVFSSDPSYIAYFNLRHRADVNAPIAITTFATGHRNSENIDLEDIDGGAISAGSTLKLIYKSKANTFDNMLEDELGERYVNIDVDISDSDLSIITGKMEDVIPYAEKAVRDNRDKIEQAVRNIEEIRGTAQTPLQLPEAFIISHQTEDGPANTWSLDAA